MDKDTRSSLQRATHAARRTLEEEFGAQLEGVFDIRPDGTVAAEAGRHLAEDGEAQRVRVKLGAAVQHHREQGRQPADAVAAVLRECAFTTLNRFVALKMLEAREIVKACVSQGPLSGGFKEFTGLAAGLATLPDQGYRLYLDSLFDEIGREVKVLFDRRDPSSLLWPRKPALDALLGILNDASLAGVWGEDETIGWVYQYFNSKDERDQMRDASQAPRNSRELAVRNQFFTPRYVVEFLTDNTLGRTWVEMRHGDTRLVATCRYLVKPPGEVFLPEGATAPPVNDDAPAKPRTSSVLFRALKDPRDLRVLDPACGSGHFLLYSFDLLLVIYEEAWGDLSSPASEATGRPLAVDYPSLDELRRALPGLVLRHNLYGVDIDPRAAQIAALALWMRAQRAWNEFGVRRVERPLVMRTNVVVAEPMPGEADLLEDLCGRLDAPVSGIVRSVFEEMKLAGDAGSLLRIEETVRQGVERLSKFGGLYAAEDAHRWDLLETRVYAALREYAEAVGGSGYRRRLFADDAVRGFAFIDILRNKYDIALMNPPFGGLVASAKNEIGRAYPNSKNDIYGCFIERCAGLLHSTGVCGALTSRTWMFLPRRIGIRVDVVDSCFDIGVLADLGHGVLDDAMVETCATTFSRRKADEHSVTFIRLVDIPDAEIKSGELRRASSDSSHDLVYFRLQASFHSLPGSPLAYWLPQGLFDLLAEGSRLGTSCSVKPGLTTRDNQRFTRTPWEVPSCDVGANWVWFAKGGAYSPFYFDTELLLNYAQDGRELKAWISGLGESVTTFIANQGSYFKAGLTYPTVTDKGFNVRVLPAGHAFSNKGMMVLPTNANDLGAFLGYLNSDVAQELLLAMSPSRSWEKSFVEALPRLPDGAIRYGEDALNLARIVRSSHFKRETSNVFVGMATTESDPFHSFVDEEVLAASETAKIQSEGAALSDAMSGMLLCSESGAPSIAARPVEYWSSGYFKFANGVDYAAAIVSYLVGVAFGRWRWPVDRSAQEMAVSAGLFSPLPARPYGGAPSYSGADVLVEDQGASADLVAMVDDLIHLAWPRSGDASQVLVSMLGATSIRDWIRRSYFSKHLNSYTQSKRIAPVYWQLGTASGSYSVWLFIHHCGPDTLHAVLRDHVEPKLRYEEDRWLRQSSETGSSPSTAQRKELAAQEAFVDELRAFRDELLRVAPLWNPDLGDGVVINASFLHRLFLHTKSWAKECEGHWEKLKAGEYDWSHLAMRLWPERVTPKCAGDRSFAIAHGVEERLWVEEGGRWRPRGTPDEEAERLVDAVPTTATRLVADLRAWAVAHGKLDWSRWWSGEHDDDPLALRLFPARVNHRMQRERALAVAHGMPGAWDARRADDPRPAPEETGIAYDVVRALAVAVGRTPKGMDVFDALAAGKLDATRLAMLANPARVIAACRQDRALAEAHQVDAWFWVDDGGWRPRRDSDEEVAAIVRARASTAIREALREVSAAPPPARMARAPRSSPAAPAPRERAPKQPLAQLPLDLGASRPRADKPALDALRAALHQFPDGAGRADLLAATGLDEAQWMPAINELVDSGEVERAGQKRGTRYTLRAGGSS
jgi:hypothetical protein